MLMSGETVRYELTLMKSSLFAFGAERVKSRTRINTKYPCVNYKVALSTLFHIRKHRLHI